MKMARELTQAEIADRIAELERAAETSRAEHAAVMAAMAAERDGLKEAHAAALSDCDRLRDNLAYKSAEHAAALGLATARIRELEGEREELLGLVKNDCDAVLSGLRNGGAINAVKAVKARIVARIEKATKGTT
jgi:hypothetical protein